MANRLYGLLIVTSLLSISKGITRNILLKKADNQEIKCNQTCEGKTSLFSCVVEQMRRLSKGLDEGTVCVNDGGNNWISGIILAFSDLDIYFNY